VDPRACMDTEARGKILWPCQGSNLDHPVVQSVARHYTDWATLAPSKVDAEKQIWFFMCLRTLFPPTCAFFKGMEVEGMIFSLNIILFDQMYITLKKAVYDECVTDLAHAQSIKSSLCWMFSLQFVWAVQTRVYCISSYFVCWRFRVLNLFLQHRQCSPPFSSKKVTMLLG
jgi:hypothetical protein